MIGLDMTTTQINIDLAILMSHPAEPARLPNAQNKGQKVRVVGSESRGGIEGMYQGEAETMGGGNFEVRAGVRMTPCCPRDGALEVPRYEAGRDSQPEYEAIASSYCF